MKRILFFCFLFSLITAIHAQDKSPQLTFQEESIYYAGKVWGFVKYYHPEARLGKFDIDSSLVVLLDKVAPTKNLKERNAVLNEWVSQFGKIKEFEKFTIKDSSQYKLFYDYSWLEDQSFDKKLSKQLIDIKNAKRTDSCHYAEFDFIIAVPNFDHEKPISPDFTQKYQKMIPLFRYWNIIEYYFPYKYLTDKKWDEVLKEYIPLFLKTEDEFDLNTAIRFLTTNINDGHGHLANYNLYMKHPFKEYDSPIELIYTKDRFIVNGLLPYYKTTGNISDYGLEIGDEIISINGIDPNELMKNEVANYWGVSNFEYLCNSYHSSLFSSDTTFMDVSYKRDGVILNGKINLERLQYQRNTPKVEEKIRITNDSIAYLNVKNISKDEVYSIIHQIHKTKGVILDMRRYPDYRVNVTLAQYLSPRRYKFHTSSGVTKKLPGVFRIEKYTMEQDYFGDTNFNCYEGKIVVLVNSSTMSNAEFSTMCFQAIPNVITIGSTTAGADGNVTYIPLTDKINTAFSSLGIYYPDGGETQRVGVRIDEKVYPTPKGIKEGRDELVERAIEIIRAK